MKFKSSFKNKELIVFDMDGTLTPSKARMTSVMSALLRRLLRVKKVAVIGGGKYALFRRQFVNRIKFRGEELKNLFLFPTSSTSFYRYERGGWRNVYSYVLSLAEKKKILRAFAEVFRDLNYGKPKKTYGVILEDRDTQITFSALGQTAPVRLKEDWNRRHNSLRLCLARLLQKKLPHFNVRVGGLTSIDVTEKGIDKAYGIRQIEKYLRVPRRKMLFVGDAIFPGGNDYAVVRAGVDYVKVSGPADTARLTRFLIKRSRAN